MIDYLIFAACFAIFLIITVLYLYKSSKTVSTIPGPEPVDLLEGNLSDIKACGSLHDFLIRIHEDYGAITSFWIGSTFCVSISTPELFQQFSSAFDKPFDLHRAAIELWGEDSVAVSNGIVARKRLLNYAAFFKTSLVNEHLVLQDKLMVKAVDSWRKWPEGQLFPLHNQIFRLVTECMVSSYFGENFLSTSQLKDLLNHLTVCWETIQSYSLNSQSADEKKFNTGRENLLKLINDAIDAKKKGSFADICQNTQYSNALFATDFLTYFTEAVYKTSALCSWACYYVAKDKNIRKKLQSEIQNIIKLDSLDISENIPKLKYTKSVLLETLRIVPIVTHTSRMQEFETILAGHKVPAGTPVIQAIGTYFQNENFFSEPTKFKPDRPELHLQTENNCTFTPFGFSGKRICPGQSSSLYFASLLLFRIFHSLSLEYCGEPVIPIFGFYPRPTDDIWISLKSV